MDKGEGIGLYACYDFTRGKRPHFEYGPLFLPVHVTLHQNSKELSLATFKDLKNATILKQHGFDGITKLLDLSNKHLLAYAEGLISPFAFKWTMHLLEFKVRFDYMAESRRDIPDYRSYPVRRFDSFLCLNKLINNSKSRIFDRYKALADFQDTEMGRNLIEKYAFSGRFWK